MRHSLRFKICLIEPFWVTITVSIAGVTVMAEPFDSTDSIFLSMVELSTSGRTPSWINTVTASSGNKRLASTSPLYWDSRALSPPGTMDNTFCSPAFLMSCFVWSIHSALQARTIPSIVSVCSNTSKVWIKIGLPFHSKNCFGVLLFFIRAPTPPAKITAIRFIGPPYGWASFLA